MSAPTVEHTPIPGMVVVRLDVREDARGWFKENWQREKMVALGLPDFGPVQNNISFNAAAGATRGIHAEPWDKFVSVGTGRVFGAWVDLREGDSFGAVFTVEITPWVAVFVPRGVGNAFQTLEDAHQLHLPGQRPLAPGYDVPRARRRRPDRRHRLADPARRGRALGEGPAPEPAAGRRDADGAAPHHRARRQRPARPGPGRGPARGHEVVGRDRLDLTDTEALRAWPWTDYDTVINAAAWTAVDAAEDERRGGAGPPTRPAPAVLAGIAREHRLTLVHYSTDYVFDGTRELHREDEPVAPLGRLRPVEGGRRAGGRRRAAPLRAPHLVGDRRRRQLRAHDGLARRPGHLAQRGRRPARSADVRRRARPGHRAPAGDRRGVRRPIT